MSMDTFREFLAAQEVWRDAVETLRRARHEYKGLSPGWALQREIDHEREASEKYRAAFDAHVQAVMEASRGGR